MTITYEERQLMSLYNPGARQGLINELADMRNYLAPEETELQEITDSALMKLKAMKEEDFSKMNLILNLTE